MFDKNPFQVDKQWILWDVWIKIMDDTKYVDKNYVSHKFQKTIPNILKNYKLKIKIFECPMVCTKF